MEIPIVNTNTNMDLYCSKLSNYFDSLLTNKTDDYLNEQYTSQSDVVKSVNLVQDELFKLNLPKELDANGCEEEEVEINDKLSESIKTFCGLLNHRLIREYAIFSYNPPLWLECLLTASSYRGLLAKNDLYSMPYFGHRSIMQLDIFFCMDMVINHLDRGDSYVGPYRIKKQDMLVLSDFVHKISRCTSEMLDSIAEALQGNRYR